MIRALVLTYHRIATGLDPLGQCVAPERFAEHLEVLPRLSDVVPLSEIAARGGSKRVALTFDDGYACNEAVAAPMLRAAGIPATFFVTGRILEDRTEYWWDRLEHAHFDRPPAAATVDVAPAGRRVRIDVRSEAGRFRSLKALSRRLRPLRSAQIEEVVATARAQLGGGAGPCQRHALLDGDGLARLARDDLFEVGSHAFTHTMLTALSPREQSEELADARAALEAATGTEVRSLAYPFGTQDAVDVSTVEAAAAAGYEFAYLNTAGALRERDPFRRPRHMVHDWDERELTRMLEGWFSAL